MKSFDYVCGRLNRLIKSNFWKKFKIFPHIFKEIIRWFSSKLLSFATDVGEETGILAISLMANRSLHLLERFLWLIIVIAAIFGAINLSEIQINRYYNSPTVISVDRDYRGWNGSLPAVTLCYYDHIDSFKANEFIQDQWDASIVDDDYFYFMDFLYALVNATSANYADLARFAEDDRFDELNLHDTIRAINRPFEQVISSFDVNFKVQAISVMTERGLCYAINSPMSEILTGRHVEFDDLKPPLTCKYGKQQCYIKMDLYESTGTVVVHSPFEVSGADVNIMALHKSDEIAASYKVLETVPSKNLRELSVEQRKCVFHDEETSQLKIYSQSLCLVRCRAFMALEMCNCVPFFYAFVEGPSCNPAGFECLLDFKWPIWASHTCQCPTTCSEIEYTIQTVKKSFWGNKLNEDGAKADVTSSFRWDLIPPKVRMRRDVVFSFEDLLVSFGGVLALFLGFSILSITRLAYVLTYHILETILDLFILLRNNFKRLIERCKKCRNRPIQEDVKNSQFINGACVGMVPLKLKRKIFIAIHRKVSKEDNSQDEIEKNIGVDNLNDKPEFEYVN